MPRRARTLRVAMVVAVAVGLCPDSSAAASGRPRTQCRGLAWRAVPIHGIAGARAGTHERARVTRLRHLQRWRRRAFIRGCLLGWHLRAAAQRITTTTKSSTDETEKFKWGSLPWWVQGINALLVLGFFAYIALVRQSWPKGTPDARAVGVRQIGASATGSFITVAVAGATLLMTATGILLSFKPQGEPVPQDVFTELVIAAVWLVVSLTAGIISAAYVLNHLHFRFSVHQEPHVRTFALVQFLTLVVGAILFVVSLFLF